MSIQNHDIEVFFDGDCPLCRREIEFLARRNDRQRILFTDISAPDFDPAPMGMTQADFMAQIRGRLADGTLVEGVEVFRRLYAAVGFTWLVAVTRLPGISHLLDLFYGWFARNRLWLTGRCEDEACAIPASSGTDS